MTDLKLCPSVICRGTNIRTVTHDTASNTCYYSIKCEECSAETELFRDTDNAISAWNTRPSGWIPCKERMPEDYQRVEVKFSTFTDGGIWTFERSDGVLPVRNLIEWQPGVGQRNYDE